MSSYGSNTFIWTGFDTLQGFFNMVSPRATEFMGEVVSDVLEEVFNESQREVPRDTGALAASGQIHHIDVGPGMIRGSVGYGARYAFFVHENMSANHPNGGKAKFLEDPMRKALDSLKAKTASRLEAALVGGGVSSGSANSSAESSSVASKSSTRRMAQNTQNIHPDQLHGIMKALDANPGQGMGFKNARGKLTATTGHAGSALHHYNPAFGEVGGMIRRVSRTGL